MEENHTEVHTVDTLEGRVRISVLLSGLRATVDTPAKAGDEAFHFLHWVDADHVGNWLVRVRKSIDDLVNRVEHSDFQQRRKTRILASLSEMKTALYRPRRIKP